MKNTIYILALLISLPLFAQHQSYSTSETPNKCIFRETFNNEFEVRDNGGTPVDVSFSDGVSSFNGTSSYVTHPNQLIGTYSIRIKLTTSSDVTSNQMIIDTRGSASGAGFVYIQNSTLSVSSGTRYINGSASNSVSANGVYDIVVTGISLNTKGNITIGANYAIGAFLNVSIDLVEIYNGILTAEEVENLNDDNRYSLPVISPILHVTAARGVIEDKQGNTLTNTDVEVVRDGSTWVMDYNGSTSILNCDDQGDLTGDVTFSFWAKPRSTGEGGLSRLFNNGGALLGTDNSITCYMYSATPYYIYFRSGESGGYAYAIGFWTYNEWNYVVITRVASTGIVNFYINGQVASVIDNTAGTPVAATQDFTIGNTYNGVASFDGFITDFIIDEGEIWSAAKISQEYTSTKHKYAK